MLKPIRASVTTNIQIIQSSILLKYLPFYRFLRRQAPKVAQEIQRAYIVSARAYYETCFRRYARSLTTIAGRAPEYATPIGTPSSAELAALALLNRTRGAVESVMSATDRLGFAKIGDVDVVPGYEADNKEYVGPRLARCSACRL